MSLFNALNLARLFCSGANKRPTQQFEIRLFPRIRSISIALSQPWAVGKGTRSTEATSSSASFSIRLYLMPACSPLSHKFIISSGSSSRSNSSFWHIP